ncbi:MAG: tetratricopeptide repeat protein [Spirochaetota bacterium]
MIDREVTVHRNIVEQMLMDVRDYIRAHRSVAIKVAIGLSVILVLGIAAVVYADYKIKKDTADFEAILDEYRTTYTTDIQEHNEKFLRTVKRLQTIADSSYFGYVHRNGYYIIASLYFNEKDYASAARYYEKAAQYASPLFASLALQQAGMASEYLNNVDEALRYYLLCESKYKDGYNSDQILYSIGRMYALKGEYYKAREYFNRVSTEFPQSFFAKKAAQHTIFLGAIESEKKN